jgi:hypothetical protein
MLVKFSNGDEIPFLYGLGVQSSTSNDVLLHYLKWKKENAEIGASEIPFEQWREVNCTQNTNGKWIYNDEDSTIEMYYACYRSGCEQHKQDPKSKSDFVKLIDTDFQHNFMALVNAWREMASGESKGDSEKKNG